MHLPLGIEQLPVDCQATRSPDAVRLKDFASSVRAANHRSLDAFASRVLVALRQEPCEIIAGRETPTATDCGLEPDETSVMSDAGQHPAPDRGSMGTAGDEPACLRKWDVVIFCYVGRHVRPLWFV